MTNYIVKSGALAIVLKKTKKAWKPKFGYETQRAFGFESSWVVDENFTTPAGSTGKIFRHSMLGYVFIHDDELIATSLSCSEWRASPGQSLLPKLLRYL